MPAYHRERQLIKAGISPINPFIRAHRFRLIDSRRDGISAALTELGSRPRRLVNLKSQLWRPGMAGRQVVGNPTPRVEGESKVSGKAVYAVDVVVPDMLWGKLVRSPIASGRIKRIDTSKAA